MTLKGKIESLLFVAVKALSVKELVKATSAKTKEVEQAISELFEDYKNRAGGLSIIRNAKSYQMLSAPDNAELVQSFLQEETKGELSQASLEALSIIAYRGPIAKLELDRIRGINCSLIIRNLLLRGLIQETYNHDKDEHYYLVSSDFIRFLGVNEIKELPDYEKLSKVETIDEVIKEQEEDN